MSDLTYQAGDWVVVEFRGRELPAWSHHPDLDHEPYLLIARLVRPQAHSSGPGWRMDRPWPHRSSEACRTPAEWVMRHATPDEVAQACMASPEGPL